MNANLPSWAVVVISIISALVVIAPALGVLLTTYTKLAGQVMQMWVQTMEQSKQLAKHEEKLNGGLDLRIDTTVESKLRSAGALATRSTDTPPGTGGTAT